MFVCTNTVGRRKNRVAITGIPFCGRSLRFLCCATRRLSTVVSAQIFHKRYFLLALLFIQIKFRGSSHARLSCHCIARLSCSSLFYRSSSVIERVSRVKQRVGYETRVISPLKSYYLKIVVYCVNVRNNVKYNFDNYFSSGNIKEFWKN